MLNLVRQAVHAILSDNPANLTPKAIAARMGSGVSLGLLYSWGDCGEFGRDIPLERLLQFTLISQDGRALAAFCDLAGYAAIPVPNLGRLGAAEPASLKALSEFSQFMNENAKALMDGVISDDELERVEKEGGEAQLAIARVIEVARRQREAGKVSR